MNIKLVIDMEILRHLGLLLLQALASAAQGIFSHTNMDTTNILSVSIPSDTRQAALLGNRFGVSGIPSSYFTNFPDLVRIVLRDNELGKLSSVISTGYTM